MRSIAILIIGLICGIGGFYLWNQKFNGSYQQDRELPIFDPEMMISFHWLLGKNKFVFQRKNQNAAWGPVVDEKRISDRLNLLTQVSRQQLSYSKLKEIKESSLVTVMVGDNSGQVWQGVWNIDWFVWTDGPLQGYGKSVKESTNIQKLFFEGHRAFFDRKYNWCYDQKLLSLQGVIDQREISIRYDGKKWLKNFMSNEPKEAQTEKIENWTRENCIAQVDFYFDESLTEPQEKLKGLLTVGLAPSGSLQLLVFENNLFGIKTRKSGNLYFYSSSFSLAIFSLINLLL